MQVYRGTERRQVGGSIWSTIVRGVRPLLKAIATILKPHAITAAKKVGRTAINVGANLAGDVIAGKLNKQQVKDTMKDEAKKLKSEAISNLKRKAVDFLIQGGRGHKRRRITPTTKGKMKRKATKRRRKTPNRRKAMKCKSRKSCKKVYKHKTKRSKSNAKKRKRSSSRKVFHDIFS